LLELTIKDYFFLVAFFAGAAAFLAAGFFAAAAFLGGIL
jgi:hypothetical protein